MLSDTPIPDDIWRDFWCSCLWIQVCAWYWNDDIGDEEWYLWVGLVQILRGRNDN